MVLIAYATLFSTVFKAGEAFQRPLLNVSCQSKNSMQNIIDKIG
jgi:hypothetical protein